MKISRLQRILQLVTILQTGRYYSPDELAGQLGISRRTIFRDLNMLREAGLPYFHDDEKGGYRMDESFFLQPVNLTLSEALALLLVTQSHTDGCGLPLQNQAREAALKIESVLPRHVQQHCGSILRKTSVEMPARAKHEGLTKTFSILQSATRRRCKVKLTYIAFLEHKQIKLTLRPYHLHFANRAWYVVGYSSLHEAVRIFKLGRIKNLEVTNEFFEEDKDFSMAKFIGDAWSLIPEGKVYDVKLRFDPLVAANVAEVLWHKNQKIQWHEDGSITYAVRVDGINEMSWWVLGYGDKVEVVEPPELRERVAGMAMKMVNIYAGR